MAELRDKILHRRSPILSRRPIIFDIEDGELAVNYNAYEPGIFIKDLDNEGNRKIRKIGPIHFGPTPPNFYAAAQGYPTELSHGEMWVDSLLGEEKYLLKIWNADSSSWIELGGVYDHGELTGLLDDDHPQYVHISTPRTITTTHTLTNGANFTGGVVGISGGAILANSQLIDGGGVTTIPDNYNANSFGPVVTIADGTEVRVGTGSYWTIRT